MIPMKSNYLLYYVISLKGMPISSIARWCNYVLMSQSKQQFISQTQVDITWLPGCAKQCLDVDKRSPPFLARGTQELTDAGV